MIIKKWILMFNTHIERKLPKSLEYVYLNWNILGKIDPLWAISTNPEKKGRKWIVKDFFEEGQGTVNYLLDELKAHDIHINYQVALDFGCGVGRITQALADHFTEIHGVDIADSMINLARKLNSHPDNCFYHLNKSQDLRLFEDSTFDFIITLITLQHVPKEFALAYISEFLRIIKPGGIVYFQVPAVFKDHSIPEQIIPDNINRAVIEKSPTMIMSGIPRSEIENWIMDHGGEIRYVIEDQWCGESWESYRYCINKLT